MSKFKFAVIIPSYSNLDYLAQTVNSCFATTENVFVYIVDDATTEPLRPLLSSLKLRYGNRVNWCCFLTHGGLTRSWNQGLRDFKLNLPNTFIGHERLDADYICCTNNDVIFTPGWADTLAYHLDRDRLDLVGPLTNAPGPVREQHIAQWLNDYVASDDPASLKNVVDSLEHRRNHFKRSPINGFCMMAKAETWFDNSYDQDFVFRPENHYNSKGQPNPTPLMTLNEDEFQGRLQAKGLRTGIALGSFVFHYRAVSRGDRFKGKDAYRPSGPINDRDFYAVWPR
jgi:GT2 family glycosyltransferase